MKKLITSLTKRHAVLVFSIVALVLSVFWFWTERGFEPAIAFFLGLAGLLGLVLTKKEESQSKNILDTVTTAKGKAITGQTEENQCGSTADLLQQARRLYGNSVTIGSGVRSVEFFEDRFTQAFPGVRGVAIFNDSGTIIERLSILFQKPLVFVKFDDGVESAQHPIWWFRGHNSMYIHDFEVLPNFMFKINQIEIRSSYIAAVNSGSPDSNFVYLEIDAMPPVGIYDYSESDIDAIAEHRGYFSETYGLFRGHTITDAELDDRRAVINGKLVDLESDAQPRRRYLTPYSLIITAQASRINSAQKGSEFESVMRKVMKRDMMLEDLENWVMMLPRQKYTVP